MTKHRQTRRRSQRGGFWNPFSSVPEDPNAPSMWSKLTGWGSSAVEKTKEVGNSIDSGLGNLGTQASNAIGDGFKSINPIGSNDVPPAASSTTVPPGSYSTTSYNYGGRRRRRARSMKGGKGGLGLTYYASPVSGLKVAEPTTMQYYGNGVNQYSVKGGSRKHRGRKSRRTHRNRKR